MPTTRRYYFADLLATGTTMPSIGILPGGVPRGINGSGGPFTAFPSTLTNSGTGISPCIVAL